MATRLISAMAIVEKLEAGLNEDDCSSQTEHERRKLTSLPANVVKEIIQSISTLGKRRVREQTSTAALLPPELLIIIFEYLSQSSTDTYLWRTTPKVTAVNRHLRNAALVCKSWYPIVTLMMYGNVVISSQGILKAFERALKKSPGLIEHIHTFSYMTLGSGILSLGAKNAHKHQQMVVNTCARLSPSTSLNLQLWEPCANHFFENPPLDLTRLTSLHLVSTPFSMRGPFSSSLTLPNLESLTIEFGCINQFSDWPKLPQLKSLCLTDAMMFKDDEPMDCSSMANLTRLELNHVLYQSEALMPLLTTCAAALEHLTIIDVRGADYLQVLRELKTMGRLRTLCVGPNIFYRDQPSLQLPPNLEELSIRDSLFSSFDLFNLDAVITENCEGLLAYLENGTILPATLRKIRGRGMHCDWEEAERTKITKLAQLRNIDFEFEEIKFSEPVERRHWHTRFWQAVKRRLRIHY